MVIGFVDRSEFIKEILDFCGNLFIYNMENFVNLIKNENGILILSKY